MSVDKTNTWFKVVNRATGKVMLAYAFSDKTKAEGWGTMDPAVWQEQIALYAELGQFTKRVPKLDEVRSKVRDDVIQAKAVELAKKKAEEIAAQLKSAPDFAKAAKAIADWANALGQAARERFGCRRENGGYIVPSESIIRDCLLRVEPGTLDRALN